MPLGVTDTDLSDEFGFALQAGFDPNLNGRDNAILSGMLQGCTRRDIEAHIVLEKVTSLDGDKLLLFVVFFGLLG